MLADSWVDDAKTSSSVSSSPSSISAYCAVLERPETCLLLLKPFAPTAVVAPLLPLVLGLPALPAPLVSLARFAPLVLFAPLTTKIKVLKSIFNVY